MKDLEEFKTVRLWIKKACGSNHMDNRKFLNGATAKNILSILNIES